LKALKEFRFDRNLRGVLFGQNMILVSGVGAELKLGQSLQTTAGVSKASIG
jgi:uncharacterized protein